MPLSAACNLVVDKNDFLCVLNVLFVCKGVYNQFAYVEVH